MAPERVAGWVDRFHDRHGELTVARTDDGVVLTTADGAEATLTLPWPVPLAAVSPSVVLDRFCTEARRSRTVALLLVRRGGYAVGVADGAALVDSKVGRRHVQGRTKAGGWSQQRYARRRDAQAREAFGAAAYTAARVLRPWLPRLETLVAGGDRAAVADVLADPRLRGLAGLPQGRFLDVPDPRQRVLVDAVRRSRAVLVDVHDPLRDD